MTGQELQQARLTALLAGVRDLTPATDGIVSGPGNQGSANQNLAGQSGTSGVQIGLPRHLNFGQAWQQ